MSAPDPAPPASAVPAWRDLQREAVDRLTAAGCANPVNEARWLVERASGLEGLELVLADAEPAPDAARAHLDVMVARRAVGEPLQYVLGRWAFLDLELLVDPRVLVPRPETELVAQVALELLVGDGARRGRADPWAGNHTSFPVADLGTGSGVLALVLASQLPDAEVWATDVSEDALAVARANLAGLGRLAGRVQLRDGSWYDALPDELRGDLRLVVSNPPYIAEAEVAALAPEVVDWEPRGALVSGPNGLEALEEIVGEAPAWLGAGGWLVCEIGATQGPAVRGLASGAGLSDIEVRTDLAGRDRVLVARR